MSKLILYSVMVVFCLVNGFSQNSLSEYELQAEKYFSQSEFLKAAEQYNKAAYNYWNKGSLKSAVVCFNKLIEINNQLNNKNAKATIQTNLGIIYSDLEDYNSALESFKKAHEIIKNESSKQDQIASLQNLATTLQYLNRYNESINYLLQAITISEELNDLKVIRKSYGLIAESYEHIKETSKAFEYYEKFSVIDKQIKKLEISSIQENASTQINYANNEKQKTEIQLDKTTNVLRQTADSLELSERLAHEQKMQLDLRNSQIREKENQIKYQQSVKRSLLIVISGVLLILVLLAFFFRQKVKDNILLNKQNIEIEKQKEEITQQKDLLDLKNTNIKASISYAQTIQNAILPIKSSIDKCFESFIIYQPKDIVSGDFYWFLQTNNSNDSERFYMAVCDCTGHGVPGAFMSLIGSRLLSDVVNENKFNTPAIILQNLNNELRKVLKQEESENNDGMDVGFCVIDKNKNGEVSLIFSGAKRPLFYYNSVMDAISVIEGDPKSIGGRSLKKENIEFANQEMKLNKGDMIFLSSDGMIDQNGIDRKRYGTTRLLCALQLNIKLPLDEQKKKLLEEFNIFIKNEEQRDDITLWGIKI